MSYGLVYTLTDSQEEAKKIANALISEKLAACCNIINNITSVYEWKGEICEDPEFLIIAKTKKNLFEEVKHCIVKNHSYEMPAIIMLPVESGLEDFLKWIGETTR